MRALAVNVVSAVLTGVGLTAVWYVQGFVFSLPDLLGAVIVPGAVANVAFIATLYAHARFGRDDLRTAVGVLATWLVVCPLVVAVLATITLVLADFFSLHKVQQASARAVLAVGLAAWLLIRGVLRKLRSA